MPLRPLILVFASASAMAMLCQCTSPGNLSLEYNANAVAAVRGSPWFDTAVFMDRRGMGPYEVGSRRPDLSAALESLGTRVPVAQVVTHAVGHALKSRGMLAPKGQARFVVSGEILELQCRQMLRPTAAAMLRVTVMEAGSGRVFGSVVRSSMREAEMQPAGVGTSPEAMGQLLSAALQHCVDQALDDGELRSRLPLEIPLSPVQVPAVPPALAPLPGALPQGALPQGALPQGALPQGALPQGALPQGALPQGALPQGALPQSAPVPVGQ
jgi:hypothetical protein